jgi:hypothetical protein
MKFMVLCLLDPAWTPAPGSQVSRCLSDTGLEPVGSSRSADGLPFGLPNAYVGEFRARDAKSLESTLSEHLGSRLPAKASTRFQLLVQSLDPVPVQRRRA